MELKYDWCTFNSVLYPPEMWTQFADQERLILIEDQGMVTDGLLSSGRRLDMTPELMNILGLNESGQLSKDALDVLSERFGVSQSLVISRKELDQAIIDAAQLGQNYLQQLEVITRLKDRKKSSLMLSKPHFVIDLFTGRLAKVLPRSFNVLVFIAAEDDITVGAKAKTLLLHVQDGRVDQFFEPDFSSLHENRLQDWVNQSDQVGDYLESRYMSPCYALFFSKRAWDRCLTLASQGESPWSAFTKFCESDDARVYPQSFMVKSMLASFRIMGYFGRV